MEIWKTITDYPNYQVSNYGNVKNIRFNRILKCTITPYGYNDILKLKLLHIMLLLEYINIMVIMLGLVILMIKLNLRIILL